MSPIAENKDQTSTSKESLSIAMAADIGYLLPTLVAIDSIFASNAPRRAIDLYLIVPDSCKETFDHAVSQIIAHHQSGRLHFLPVDPIFDSAHLSISHITTPTYYRLALPELLPHIDHCLYLDGDIIVLGDLGSIVDSLSSDTLIAGVRAAGYFWPEKDREMHRARLGLPEFTNYLNAGVLAMNLKLMRDLDCPSQFKSLLDAKYASQDQDIINKVCHEHARSLPPCYNVMTKYHPEEDDSYANVPCLSACYTEEEWRKAQQHPVIIHFADRFKPWQTDKVDFSQLWWSSALAASDHIDVLRASLPLIQKTIKALAASSHSMQLKTSECDQLKKQLEDATEANALLRFDYDKSTIALKQCQDELEGLGRTLKESTAQLSRANQTIERLYASRSWKIGRTLTSPVRAVKRLRARLATTMRHKGDHTKAKR